MKVIKADSATKFSTFLFPSDGDEYPSPQERPDLDELRSEAKSRGFEQGYQAGEKAGHQEGYENGLLKGVREGEGKAKEINELAYAALDDAIRQVKGLQDELSMDFKSKSLDVVQAVAEKLVLKEISIHPDIIIDWIELCLDNLPESPTEVQVLINDGDYQRLLDMQALPENDWSIKGSAVIKAGCCDIKTNMTDIQIDTHQRVHALVEQLRHD